MLSLLTNDGFEFYIWKLKWPLECLVYDYKGREGTIFPSRTYSITHMYIHKFGSIH